MFNIESLSEIAGSSSNNSNLTELTTEHCSVLLVAESVADMARPVRRFSTNERIAIQQQFNRTIALKIKEADGSTADSLQELATQAAMRVQAANQTGEEDAIEEAVQRLERVINLFADIAASVTRNGFYRHEECVRQETPIADGSVTGVDGAIGVYETKSKYAGWKRVSVEATTMEDAVKLAVDGLVSVIGALLPMASAYLQGLFIKPAQVNQHLSRGKVTVQLGFQRQPEAKDGEAEYIQFYTIKDVWKSIAANRKEVKTLMSADEASASFHL